MSVPLLSTVLAQSTARTTLERALSSGRVHHAYLFDGPDGVGKELAAFGLAQALVCSRRAPDGAAACGECSSCVRAVPRAGGGRPAHPDIVVLERGLYDPSQIGRRTPETQDISIDQVRTLVLARAAFSPHEGRAKVFIIRRAEELSVSAANALLKTLEEPGRDSYFVLLSSRAEQLLPTVRSRSLRVRFSALPEAIVEKLLTAEGIPAERAASVAKIARGSVELARTLADPEQSDEREAFVAGALSALAGPHLGPSLELAEEAKKRKDGLDLRLEALASRLADDAKAAAGATDSSAMVAARRYELTLEAARQLEGNASAQLVVEAMLLRMRELSP